MNTAWQTKKLGEIDSITFLRGNGLSKSFLDMNGGSKCILYGELYTKYTHPVITSIASKTDYKGNVKSEAGDVLVPGTTTADAYGIAIARSLNEKGIIIGGDINVLRTNNEEVLADYLSYFLNGPAKRTLASYATGTNIMHLSNKKIQKIEITYPAIPEQKKIVATLDKVFEKVTSAKEAAEKNLENANELFKSYLQEVVKNYEKHNELVYLSELATDITDGDHMPPPKSVTGVPFITISNIDKENNTIDFGDTFMVEPSYYQKLKNNRKPRKGDVLYTVTGSFGIPVLIEDDLEFCFQRHIGLIRPKREVDSKWLSSLILSPQLFAQATAGATGTAQKTVSLKVLRNFMVPKVSISEQKTLVKKLNILSTETKKLRTIYMQKLSALEELKRSVLKKAFSGKITAPTPIRSVSVPSVQINTPSPYIRNQVHAAIIDQVSRDGGWSTEVAVAKYDHLLQEVFGLPLGYEFQTHQFGPFDAKIKRLVSSGLNGNKWFTKKNGMIVYGSNVRGLLFRQSNMYRNAQAIMRQLSNLGVTKLDAEKVELLSTVCHSIKKTDSVALDKVRDFMSQWKTDNNRTKAEKFSSEQTQKCLDFIVRNNLHQRLLQQHE